MENKKTCCCTGHRPKGFPWFYGLDKKPHKKYLKVLKEILEEKIEQGYGYFIAGGALGADSDFAETVLALKKRYRDIQLEIAVPCPNQDLKWTFEDKKRYQKILDKADKVTLVSDHYTRWCMHDRNRYMVDHSDCVVAIWNGEESGGTYNTICYAQKTNTEIHFLYLSDI